MAGNAVLSTRGLLSDPNPSCLTAKVPQVKLVYREANSLPLYCTWPRTTEGCFGRWVWSAWTPWLLLRAAASQKHLLSIFSLGCQGAPGVSVWHGTSEFPTDLTQDLSKVVALCVWGTHLLPGDPEVQCVLRLAALAQPYEAFTWCFFLMPGGAYSSIGDFLEPPNWWVSLIKVCCSWASILLSYPAAMVGKAGFAPSCLCWYCLLFAICVISPLAFFPLCKWRVLSLDI